MLQKTALILAIAAACAAPVHAQSPTAPASAPANASTPAKRELVARILKVQQPGIEGMARDLVGEPLAPLLQSAAVALQERVAPEKREAVAKDIQGDVRKFNDETTALVRDRALKLAPTTIGPILEEKFTEDELKQLATMLESPILNKFQSIGGDIQRALVEKVVSDTRGQVEPKLRTLRETVAKRLGITPGANGGAPAAAAPSAPAAPAASGRAPARK